MVASALHAEETASCLPSALGSMWRALQGDGLCRSWDVSLLSLWSRAAMRASVEFTVLQELVTVGESCHEAISFLHCLLPVFCASQIVHLKTRFPTPQHILHRQSHNLIQQHDLHWFFIAVLDPSHLPGYSSACAPPTLYSLNFRLVLALSGVSDAVLLLFEAVAWAVAPAGILSAFIIFPRRLDFQKHSCMGLAGPGRKWVSLSM